MGTYFEKHNPLFLKSLRVIHKYNSTISPDQCIKVIQREAHKQQGLKTLTRLFYQIMTLIQIQLN